MPHLRLEYGPSKLLPAESVLPLLQAAHEATAAVGAFALSELKSRAVPCDLCLVGDAAFDSDLFVHATLTLLAGREARLRAALGEAVYAALVRLLRPLGRSCRLSVEVREMDPASYQKGRTN